MNCSNCGKEVKGTWKYCRFCGTEIQRTHVVTEEAPELEDIELNLNYDKDDYFRVLSTRRVRNKINKRKAELKAEIKHVMEQKKAGFLTAEVVAKKIKELKKEVDEVNRQESELSDIPENLPVEDLVDQIEATLSRIKKIKSMKVGDGVSKETMMKELKKSEETLTMLRGEHSKLASKIRVWQNEFEAERDRKRKEIESLNLRKKLGEITDEYYTEEKKKLVAEVEELDFVIKNIDLILKV